MNRTKQEMRNMGILSLIGEQKYFMTLCRQKHYNLLQTINGIKNRDAKLLAAIAMASGLIKEEWRKETEPVIQEILAGRLTQLGNFAVLQDHTIDELLLDKLVVLADGMIDTIYVCAGFLNMFGFPGDELWDIVQERNVAKAEDCPTCQGGIAPDVGGCDKCENTGKVIVRRADGKILKPDGWYPPEPEIKALFLQKLKELKDAGKPSVPD